MKIFKQMQQVNRHIITYDYFGVKTRCYFGSYEKEVEPNGTVTHIDYIFAPSGLAAIVKTPALEAVGRGLAGDDIVEISIPGANRHIFYYVTTDNLGSISLITNASRGTVSRYYYQPFGGRILLDGTDITPRGYTFHEHLSTFGLINMNGRMYDPVLARFLSPDPYVQMPDFTQSFNRYAYCLNNPFKFTDPNGEFVITFIVNTIIGWARGDGFVGGLKTGANAVKNFALILGGLITTDKNKSFGGQLWELISRFTWQLPQTLVGFTYAYFSNLAGQVDNVDYKAGATVMSGNFWGNGGAVTISNYIHGQPALEPKFDNWLFQHEYGHYLQSQASGPAYLFQYGLPSAFSKNIEHNYHAVEQDANARAFKYFSKRVKGFNWIDENGKQQSQWHGKDWENPIMGYDWSKGIDDASNVLALDFARLKVSWYTAIFPFFGVIYDGIRLNSRDYYLEKFKKMREAGLILSPDASYFD